MDIQSLHRGSIASVVPKPKGCVGYRHLMAFLLFFGLWTSYGLRVNISVAVVAMVNHTAVEESPSNTSSSLDGQCFDPNTNDNEDDEDEGGSFEWSMAKQGLILGAFYYGYSLTQIPGGFLAERYGGKLPFGLGMALASICTLLNPLAANASPIFLIFMRILQGCLEGAILPATYAISAKWMPEQEKSTLLTIVFSGISAGLIVTLPLSGILAQQLGWEYIFYVTGGLGCMWAILFLSLAADSPSKHKRISETELKYIEANSKASQGRAPTPPYKAIITSMPVWFLVLVHFGNNWGYFTLMSATPLYLSSIQNFELEKNGLLSALPHIVNLIITLIVGNLSDWSISSKKMTKTFSRKFFNSIGAYGSAVCLVCLGFVGCHRTLAVVALCLANGINAFVYGGYMIMFNDLAPNYSGTLLGIANTVGMSASFLGPLIMGLITDDNDTVQGWRVVFLIGASVLTLTNTLFIVFGSAEMQSWNESKDEKSHKTERI